MQATEKALEYFAQYGPWALLAVLLLLAVGLAARRIYMRMADALDNMHAETVKMAQAHAEDIKMRDNRLMECVDNNTKAFTTFGERMNGVEDRLSNVESAVDKLT